MSELHMQPLLQTICLGCSFAWTLGGVPLKTPGLVNASPCIMLRLEPCLRLLSPGRRWRARAVGGGAGVGQDGGCAGAAAGPPRRRLRGRRGCGGWRRWVPCRLPQRAALSERQRGALAPRASMPACPPASAFQPATWAAMRRSAFGWSGSRHRQTETNPIGLQSGVPLRCQTLLCRELFESHPRKPARTPRGVQQLQNHVQLQLPSAARVTAVLDPAPHRSAGVTGWLGMGPALPQAAVPPQVGRKAGRQPTAMRRRQGRPGPGSGRRHTTAAPPAPSFRQLP